MPRKIFTWVVLAVLVVTFVGVLGASVLPETAQPDLALGPVTLRDVLFYAFALLTVGGAAGVAFSRNILYSAIGLLLALMGAGSIYVFLSADFLAVTQLLVYIGGVLVLVLFAVMLTSKIGDVNVSNTTFGRGSGFTLLAAVAPVLVFVAVRGPWDEKAPGPLAPTTALIGNEFLTRWLLPFELASLVLLATLVGAVVMARRDIKAD